MTSRKSSTYTRSPHGNVLHITPYNSCGISLLSSPLSIPLEHTVTMANITSSVLAGIIGAGAGRLVWVDPEESLWTAARRLLTHHIHRLPIIDPSDNSVLHIITHRKINNFLVKNVTLGPSCKMAIVHPWLIHLFINTK